MPSYPINYNLYSYHWKKYRPALVKLMKDSADEPQQYQFIQHEFKDINPKEKGGHTFTLEALYGKAVNNIKMSVVAQDLLLSLQASGKAMELMQTATYTFELDKQYLLRISRVAIEEETEEEETVGAVVEGETTVDSEVQEAESTEDAEEKKSEEAVN